VFTYSLPNPLLSSTLRMEAVCFSIKMIISSRMLKTQPLTQHVSHHRSTPIVVTVE
jgi:hypothetical protein